jgi:nucleoside-diphosphate-sugar epimerase
MKILVAGATGAIGKRLVPKLIAAGHTVVGTTRSAAKSASLESIGAKALVLDALRDGNVVSAAIRKKGRRSLSMS